MTKKQKKYIVSFMGITQKDIARDLGISFITVNRVFNNSGYVSAKLKNRILNYAKKKNYIPHRASQIMVRNKVRTITLFTSAGPPFFWREIEKGVMMAAEYLRSLNYIVRFIRVPSNDSQKYCGLLKSELKKGLDAAAFVYQRIFDMDKIIGIAENAGIPFFMYNIDDPKKRGLGYVGPDNNEGGRLAANFIGQIMGSRSGPEVLIINEKKFSGKQNIIPEPNTQRLEGFLSVIKEQYPQVHCSICYIEDNDTLERQLQGILNPRKKKKDAIYMISPRLTQFHQALRRTGRRQSIILQHDIDDEAVDCLENNIISAAIYQDPILQGYSVVRTLEKALEAKTVMPRQEIKISHSLIFKENIDFLKNHYFLGEVNDK